MVKSNKKAMKREHKIETKLRLQPTEVSIKHVWLYKYKHGTSTRAPLSTTNFQSNQASY